MKCVPRTGELGILALYTDTLIIELSWIVRMLTRLRRQLWGQEEVEGWRGVDLEVMSATAIAVVSVSGFTDRLVSKTSPRGHHLVGTVLSGGHVTIAVADARPGYGGGVPSHNHRSSTTQAGAERVHQPQMPRK